MRPTGDVAKRLRRRAALRSAIEAPDFVLVRWTARLMPASPRYAPEVHQLLDLAYGDGWVRASLDGPARSHRAKAIALIEDPAAMARATPLQLARVLTVLVRAERYAEGAQAGVLESGLVRRLLRRVPWTAERVSLRASELMSTAWA